VLPVLPTVLRASRATFFFAICIAAAVIFRINQCHNSTLLLFCEGFGAYSKSLKTLKYASGLAFFLVPIPRTSVTFAPPQNPVASQFLT
jgi:hypothetical protein